MALYDGSTVTCVMQQQQVVECASLGRLLGPDDVVLFLCAAGVCSRAKNEEYAWAASSVSSL